MACEERRVLVEIRAGEKKMEMDMEKDEIRSFLGSR